MPCRRSRTMLSLAAGVALAAGAVTQVIAGRPIVAERPPIAAPVAARGGGIVSVVSRITQSGIARDIALPADGTGIEPRTAGGKLTLLFTFDHPAKSATAAVTTGNATLDGSVTTEGSALVVKLSNVADLQSVGVSLTNVTLDGGVAGKASFAFRTLEGDANADGVVNAADVSLVKSAVRSVYRPGQSRLDVNATGSVTSSDVTRLSRLSGRSLLGGKQKNTPPTMATPPALEARAGKTSLPSTFAVGDAESPATLLDVTAVSSDPTLIPAGGITVLGEGKNRQIMVTPAAGRTGKATITVTTSDGLASTSSTAEVNVLPADALMVARLSPQPGTVTLGGGYATVKLAPDESTATIDLTISNLTVGPNVPAKVSPPTPAVVTTNVRLYGPADPGQTGQLLLNVFDLPQNMDGTYTWTIAPVGGLSASDISTAIKTGKTYVNVETTTYAAGELRGQAVPIAQDTFVPPAAPSFTLPAAPTTDAEAVRWLQQTTFGANDSAIADLKSNGYAAWYQAQVDAPQTRLVDLVNERLAAGDPVSDAQFYDAWWQVALTAPDQLRQRVAFALSEIMVISQVDGDISTRPQMQAHYYDLLAQDAFLNYRTLLEDVTLHPAQGLYLDMLGNRRAYVISGTTQIAAPNENYAREIMQLFSFGLVKLNPDGSPILVTDSTAEAFGQPAPTYDQNVVVNLARVFTGWTYRQTSPSVDYYRPMTVSTSLHDFGTATISNGVQAVVPRVLFDGITLPNRTSTSTAAGQNADLADALNAIFNNASTGPFVAKNLIQRLVTSNPSPGYIYRVAQVFANNGQGVRGDLKAVVYAILTDYEARSAEASALAGFGKQKEPVLRVSQLIRAFRPQSTSGFFKVGATDSNLFQTALRSPTVFNFYEPGYVYPGTLANAGLLAPEFALSTETQVVAATNFINNGTAGVFNSDVKLDYSYELSIAADSNALLARLNTILMGGTMSTRLQTKLGTYLAGTSQTVTLNGSTVTVAGTENKAASGGYLTNRVTSGIHLITTSAEFTTQR